MRGWLPVVWTICSLSIKPNTLIAQEANISQLEWLIGVWTFEDVEINGEYRETGTRACEYALGDEYIVCESRGTDHRGRERSYLWYINYNDREQRFEVTSLLQGFAGKLLYTAEVLDDGRRLELTYGSWEGNQIVVEGGATVTYDGSGRYVWENDRFRDVAVRRQ